MESNIENYEQLVRNAVEVVSDHSDWKLFLEKVFSAIGPNHRNDFDNIDLNLIDKCDLFNPDEIQSDDEQSALIMTPNTNFANQTTISVKYSLDGEIAPQSQPVVVVANGTTLMDGDIEPENTIQLLCNENNNASWEVKDFTYNQSVIEAKALEVVDFQRHITFEEYQQPEVAKEMHYWQYAFEEIQQPEDMFKTDNEQNTVPAILQPGIVQEMYDEQRYDLATANDQGEIEVETMYTYGYLNVVDSFFNVNQPNQPIKSNSKKEMKTNKPVKANTEKENKKRPNNSEPKQKPINNFKTKKSMGIEMMAMPIQPTIVKNKKRQNNSKPKQKPINICKTKKSMGIEMMAMPIQPTIGKNKKQPTNNYKTKKSMGIEMMAMPIQPTIGKPNVQHLEVKEGHDEQKMDPATTNGTMKTNGRDVVDGGGQRKSKSKKTPKQTNYRETRKSMRIEMMMMPKDHLSEVQETHVKQSTVEDIQQPEKVKEMYEEQKYDLANNNDQGEMAKVNTNGHDVVDTFDGKSKNTQPPSSERNVNTNGHDVVDSIDGNSKNTQPPSSKRNPKYQKSRKSMRIEKMLKPTQST